MIRFTVFSLLLLFTQLVSAQTTVSGRVLSARDSTVLSGADVRLGGLTHRTGVDGRFSFAHIRPGQYLLEVTHSGHEPHRFPFAHGQQETQLVLFLEPRTKDLKEVVVSDKQTDFGFTRLRSVENMGIYEGKKSEVIVPDQLVANLATNNARQIYSRVAGLNIWENDGAGLQLSIGGRGLDPNRTSNFNVRQNGYDISADALGYPESYYTPPVEAVGRIQMVRGAASLQYGTQFGGLINFEMKKPVADRPFELVARQTVGSFGFYNAFTSASGTNGRFSHYTFFQYKRGDGWRKNSDFDNYTFYTDLNYRLSDRTRVGIDITHMSYLAHQPGGLSDAMFAQDPRQTNRERNWFKVNWNLWALHLDHQLTPNDELNFRVFGLSAYRYSLGFRPNRVATVDDQSERDLIKGDFTNWGAEGRYLKRYAVASRQSVLLTGARYYHGFNHSVQGLGSTSKTADFHFVDPDQGISYDYRFPNRNVSIFAENIFYLSDKVSVTPGVRFEWIRTKADGFYGTILYDLAGNILDVKKTQEQRTNGRQFVIAGIGLSYKPNEHAEAYGNISQNYRSITFSDMRISNPSSFIDPNMKDEKGFSLDAGIRSRGTSLFSYDVSGFLLNYNNRIGEVQFYDENDRVLRMRSNIGQALIFGLESYGEVDFLKSEARPDWSGVVFGNLALIRSTYNKSDIPGVKGNQVEFVPAVNLKSGVRFGYRKFRASLQYTYLSQQYSDATNAKDGGVSAVVGLIPSYAIWDATASYTWKRFRLEGSLNNLANRMYFTRRATGYPGPGILPSDGRSVYVTLQFKL